MDEWMQAYIYVYFYACIYVRMHVNMYVCMQIYMHVWDICLALVCPPLVGPSILLSLSVYSSYIYIYVYGQNLHLLF